jgi:hypothetical protein
LRHSGSGMCSKRAHSLAPRRPSEAA